MSRDLFILVLFSWFWSAESPDGAPAGARSEDCASGGLGEATFGLCLTDVLAGPLGWVDPLLHFPSHAVAVDVSVLAHPDVVDSTGRAGDLEESDRGLRSDLGVTRFC